MDTDRSLLSLAWHYICRVWKGTPVSNEGTDRNRENTNDDSLEEVLVEACPSEVAKRISQFSVEYAQKYWSTVASDPYNMTVKHTPTTEPIKQGYALVLNVATNGKYDNSELLSMRYLLRTLNFDLHEVCDRASWTQEEIKQCLEEFRDACENIQPKAIFIYIRSKGRKDFIVDRDELTLELEQDLLFMFYKHRSNCKYVGTKKLEHIPKIVLIDWEECRLRKCNLLTKIRCDFPTTKNLLVCLTQINGFVTQQCQLPTSYFAHCFFALFTRFRKEQPLFEIVHIPQRILQSTEFKDEFGSQPYLTEIWEVHFDSNFRFD